VRCTFVWQYMNGNSVVVEDHSEDVKNS
jgi:hypothetical protein